MTCNLANCVRSLSAQEAPRRIRTRGCSWYHLISQLTLPLYAAPTSDSSVTGLPGDFYSLRSADRAVFKISAPKLLPHLRLRTGLAAGEAFAVLSENALPEPVSLSVGRSVLLFFHAFVYEYASTLPQAAAFVKRNFPSRHSPLIFRFRNITPYIFRIFRSFSNCHFDGRITVARESSVGL